jgi:hypothetical protein
MHCLALASFRFSQDGQLFCGIGLPEVTKMFWIAIAIAALFFVAYAEDHWL